MEIEILEVLNQIKFY